MLFQSPTIAQLSAAIDSSAQLSSATPHSHLIPLQPSGTKPTLFCIHPAGGHVFCYLPLTRELGPLQPVFGLQASGLEDGETLASSIEQMAADYIAAIQSAQPEGPYQLLGMSSGGLIAFEMARQIKERGGEVSLLALLDTTVPDAAHDHTSSEAFVVRAMAGELGCADLLQNAPPTTTLAELVEIGIAAGRLPVGFGLTQAERIAAVFRNTVRIHFNYQLQKWQGQALLLRAMRRDREGDTAPDWSPFISDLDVVDLDCSHAELVTPALSPIVAAHISGYLK